MYPNNFHPRHLSKSKHSRASPSNEDIQIYHLLQYFDSHDHLRCFFYLLTTGPHGTTNYPYLTPFLVASTLFFVSKLRAIKCWETLQHLYAVCIFVTALLFPADIFFNNIKNQIVRWTICISATSAVII